MFFKTRPFTEYEMHFVYKTVKKPGKVVRCLTHFVLPLNEPRSFSIGGLSHFFRIHQSCQFQSRHSIDGKFSKIQ